MALSIAIAVVCPRRSHFYRRRPFDLAWLLSFLVVLTIRTLFSILQFVSTMVLRILRLFNAGGVDRAIVGRAGGSVVLIQPIAASSC